MTDDSIGIGCGGLCQVPNEIEFQMAFQPVVDVAAKRVYAYEALVRGPQGEGAAAVLSGVTPENRYAFDQACRVEAIRAASRLGLDRRLNINFLPNAVYHPEACLGLTFSTASAYDFPPNLITFEFTENEKIMDRDHLKGIVEVYREKGFQTALDDFGAGYAGLSLLADFQPDIIKIDRFLVDNVHNSPQRKAIILGILGTAKAMNIAVVAEGVETTDEFHALEDLGIHMFQGFLFARPALNRLIGDDEINWS